MSRKVAVFTGSRAEYGLLFWLLREIEASATLQLQIIVGGMHLSPEFGETWREIENDGFAIDAKVEMLLSSDSAVGVAKAMGLGTIGFADALLRLAPDVLVVLGDRFEALAVVQTALVMRIPVAHLHGGEITEGAYDDAIRHAITKMSSVHFVAAEPYRRRVIQLGEAPDRVFNVGALGLDHIGRSTRITHAALSESLGFPLREEYFLVTYHPVTLADEDPEVALRALLQAIDRFPGHDVILTYPNADNGGRALIPVLEEYARLWPQRAMVVPSLGFERYLSAMCRASAVIGNSSSGLIEAPSFGVPTIDIGTRQRGRLCADSVMHCPPTTEGIAVAIAQALTPEFGRLCKSASNPYGEGDASRQIVRKLEGLSFPGSKRFFDLESTS